MDRLSGMLVFAAVVEAGSFTAAAEQLGQTKSAVSKQVSRLEDRLGARLMNRTTRKLSLTDVGHAFYERCRRIVEEAEEAELAVSTLQQCPRGRLRITAPHSYGNRHLVPLLPEFMTRYPDITVEIFFNDRRVDLVEDGYDLAVRAGNLGDSSLIARKVDEASTSVCAAPSYWDRHGRPGHPDELADHNCFTYAYRENPGSWSFTAPDGTKISTRVGGRLHTNSGEPTLAAAIAGLGVGYLPGFFTEDAIRDGTLEPVLEDYTRETIGVYAIYPHTRHVPTKVRVFIDFLVEALKR